MTSSSLNLHVKYCFDIGMKEFGTYPLKTTHLYMTSDLLFAQRQQWLFIDAKMRSVEYAIIARWGGRDRRMVYKTSDFQTEALVRPNTLTCSICLYIPNTCSLAESCPLVLHVAYIVRWDLLLFFLFLWFIDRIGTTYINCVLSLNLDQELYTLRCTLPVM